MNASRGELSENQEIPGFPPMDSHFLVPTRYNIAVRREWPMSAEKSTDIHWFDEAPKPARIPPRPVPAVPTPIKPDNRRRHARFQVSSTQVILHRDSIFSALNLGSNKARKVCDLSQGGARILATERLNVDQKVRLKITLEKYQDQIE